MKGDGTDDGMWLRRITAVLVAVSAYVLWPMAAVLLISGFVVIVAQRPFERLVKYFGGRRKLAALVTTVVLVFLFFTPVIVTAYIGLREAASAVRSLAGELAARGGWESAVSGLPPSLRSWVEPIATPVAEAASGAGRGLLAAAPRLLPSFGWSVAQLFLCIVTVFALFEAGPAVVATAQRLIPLAPASSARLFEEFREVAQGLFGGGLLILLFHGTAAALGYWIFGIHSIALLALLSALASIIPLVGASLVWAPLAIELAISGHPFRAIGLAAWGLLVIGAGEYALRPWVSKGHMALPRILLFLMFFGGVQVWGPKGLLLGPLVGSLAITALRLVRNADSAPRPTAGPDRRSAPGD